LSGWRLPAGIALAAVLAACGQPAAYEATVDPNAPTVDVTMREYRFNPNPIQVTAGRIRFRISNVGTVGHDFSVLTPDGTRRIAHTALVPPGSWANLSVDLAAGIYPVICTQPGHQELGMETTVVASPKPNGG